MEYKFKPVEIVTGKGFTIWFRQPTDQIKRIVPELLSLPSITNPEIVVTVDPEEAGRGIPYFATQKNANKIALYYYIQDYLIPELYQKVFVDNIKKLTDFTTLDMIDSTIDLQYMGVPFISDSRVDPLLNILYFFYYSRSSMVNYQDFWDIVNAVRFFLLESPRLPYPLGLGWFKQ